MAESEEPTVVDGLDKALEHIDRKGAEAQAKFESFSQNVFELTGKKLHEQVNALDVVKIVRNVFGFPMVEK